MAEEEMTILTAKEAADYLRVSLYTLRRMESDGSLIPYRTPGGHRRYSLRMLNEYLEQSRTSSRRRESENASELQ
jgi:excisionase family DNA binding protein